MKKILLLISILFLSCSKDEIIDEIIDNNTPIVASIDFRNETYFGINNSVGNIERQKYNLFFPSYDYIWDVVVQNTNVDSYYPDFRASVQYDFFDDKKIDLLVFCAGSNESIPGIYVLIEDVLEDDYVVTTFPSKLYAANSTVLSDTNGDGKNEMLLFGENTHNNATFNGLNNYLETGYKIYFDSQKNIIEEKIGNLPIGVHDVSSGDIDNDGDIDIVLSPTGVNPGSVDENIKFPIKLINDGNGNFTEYPFFEDEVEIIQTHGYNEWITTSHHLFDINGDGYLDLIAGNYIGIVDPRFSSNTEFIRDKKDLTFAGIFISYGNSSGTFTYTNTEYYGDSAFNDISQQLYGLTFTDYDLDGDYDIILSTFKINTDISLNLDSSNYILHLLENRNNDFVNVTESVIDGYYDFTETVFSVFYKPIIHDIDNDGDFDIVATAYNYHNMNINYLKMLYWEKNGSSYIRREIQ